jgi:hypothetical protein
MSTTVDNYRRIRAEIPPHVQLLAVSKNHSIEKILELYETGVRDFGENKVQELLEKASKLPSDIRWHLIGHLQRNKVKPLIQSVYLIHSLDSVRLFHEILKEARRLEIKISALIQVQISSEDTKFGMPFSEVIPFLTEVFPLAQGYISIQGLMGMASNVSDKGIVEAEFKRLNSLFHEIKLIPQFSHISLLSMGMSQDWPLAVQEGSTCVRVGSDIFGLRG